MIQMVTRAAILAALTAPLSACLTANEEFLKTRDTYGDETATAPLLPGFENRNGCQRGLHGVPAPNGNGFRCVQNGY
jgi:hypothetical protein